MLFTVADIFTVLVYISGVGDERYNMKSVQSQIIPDYFNSVTFNIYTGTRWTVIMAVDTEELDIKVQHRLIEL